MLLAFHIRNAAGLPAAQNEAAGSLNPEALWQDCIALGQTLSIPALEKLKSLLRCYHNGHFAPELEDQDATLAEQTYHLRQLDLLDLPSKDGKARSLSFYAAQNGQEPTLYGEFYPQRIHDTYAIDLTLRLEGTFPLSQLTSFAPLQAIQPSLGRTLVLVVEPVDTPPENNLAFANACATQFLQQPESHCRPTAQGQFFGNPLFEYTPPDPHHPDHPLHLWVWLNRNPAALGLIDQPEPYHALINLLCALHKSRFAFAQATSCYQQAQAIAHQLEGEIAHLAEPAPTDSDQFLAQSKSWLQTTPRTAFDYARRMRDIEDHRTTLTTNTTNYRTRLEVLQRHSPPGDDLTFLTQVLDDLHRQEQQIAVWQRYLASSQPLFQQLIDTICGLVDIAAQEQAQTDERREMERDRDLQIAIAAVGGGLAVSGITSQVAPSALVLMPSKPQPSAWPYWSALAKNALFHVGLGLCFALVVYGVLRCIQNTKSP